MLKKIGIGAFLSLSLVFSQTQPTDAITLKSIGSYSTGIFDEGAAEISAYDKTSKRLFVINGAQQAIDVLDIAKPEKPVKLFAIDLSPYGNAANSVAVSPNGGLIAAAVEAKNKQDKGKIVFFDSNGNEIISYGGGALPDMITFTPDGNYVLVANEGEPSSDYKNDPEGSVSILDVTNLNCVFKKNKVRDAHFRNFNDQKDALKLQGLRVFGPNALLSQDVEPEYIAVSADSRTAWVTLQENNAIAEIDIVSADVTKITPLAKKPVMSGPATLQIININPYDLPVIGTTSEEQQLGIRLAGFSGLMFNGITSDGKWRFLTHSDRGPNGEPIDFDGDGVLERPFLVPTFQPSIVSILFDPTKGTAQIEGLTGLKKSDGAAITGLPNLPVTPLTSNKAYTDEIPIDFYGRRLGLDPLGADFEGIVKDEKGTFWMADEYRPSIYNFDASGKLIARYVPKGSGSQTGIEALPAELAQRWPNRGFEGIAYSNGKVYAFLQSPLDNPDTANDANAKASTWTRIVEFDPTTKTTTAQYIYPMEQKKGTWSKGNNVDKIGDAIALGDGKFLVIERDSSVGSIASKYIFYVDINGATNLETLDASIKGKGGTLELMKQKDLIAAKIVPAYKTLYVDLTEIGYVNGDKVEGLTLISNDDDKMVLAVINDNDFGLIGDTTAWSIWHSDLKIGKITDYTKKLIFSKPPTPIELGLITIKKSPIDASKDDKKINFAHYPVIQMYMPDAMASYTYDNKTFLITANEGDAREYDAYTEETSVKDVKLDPFLFPNAKDLQDKKNAGGLKISAVNGDTDNDGDYDRLYAFGGRSFSIWDAETGYLVYDSGDDFEKYIANSKDFSKYFNANSTSNDFDKRSNSKGPEPEGVAIGKIGSSTYAFIALEKIGGLMVYNISNPYEPKFETYVNTRNFNADPEKGAAGDLAPEGVLFIPADISPNKKPLVVTSNEVSGTVTIFQVD